MIFNLSVLSNITVAISVEKAKDAKTDAINKRKKQESKKRSFLTCRHHRLSVPTLSARKYATAPSTDWGSFSASPADLWTVASTAAFGVSMILLYTASTLYHAVPYPRVKKVLKKFDHIAIYYLIAGSYTPFLLVNMRGPVGWSVFAVIWSLALIGTVLRIITSGSGTKLWSISLYLIMGWAIIFVSRQLFAAISAVSALFLVLGGLFYTFGVFFYVWKSKKYTHAVWHLMVLAGTVMHFFAVLYACVLV